MEECVSGGYILAGKTLDGRIKKVESGFDSSRWQKPTERTGMV